MLAEILTIGDEVCRGEIVDTNSAYLAAELWELGVTPAWLTSCRDVVPDMVEAIQTAAARADLVLISGGLGPTADDLTVAVLAQVAGVGVVKDAAALERVKVFLHARGRPLTPNNERQAEVPAGAIVLPNSAGLAPGFELVLGRARIQAFPGVPRELKAIWNEHGRARVAALRAGEPPMAKAKVRVFGMGESQADALLDGLVEGVAGATIHYQVSFPEVWVKFVVRGAPGETAPQVEARVRALVDETRRRLGPVAFAEGDDSLPKVTLAALEGAGATLAWAESCTGGLLGALLTDIPGASRTCWGGFVVYANEAKVALLGVRPETLAVHGAVSPETAREMARGARTRSGATFGVAITGIAGPDGGTADKPVGTVCLAVAGPGDLLLHKTILYPAARDQVRHLGAAWAMNLVLQAASSLAAQTERETT